MIERVCYIENQTMFEAFKHIAAKYDWERLPPESNTIQPPLYIKVWQYDCPYIRAYGVVNKPRCTPLTSCVDLFNLLGTVSPWPSIDLSAGYSICKVEGRNSTESRRGVQIFKNNVFKLFIPLWHIVAFYERMHLYHDRSHEYYFPKIYYDVQPAAMLAITEYATKRGWQIASIYTAGRSTRNIILHGTKQLHSTDTALGTAQVNSTHYIFETLSSTGWEKYYKPYEFNTDVPGMQLKEITADYVKIGDMTISYSTIGSIYRWFYPLEGSQ